MDDLHRAPAEHVARPDDHGKANLLGDSKRVFGALGDPAARPLQVELGEQVVEALTILSAVDCVRGGAENGNAGTRQRNR